MGGADKGDTVKNFLKTLADNNRLGLLQGVCEKFGTLMGAARGEVDLTVTSAQVTLFYHEWRNFFDREQLETRREDAATTGSRGLKIRVQSRKEIKAGPEGSKPWATITTKFSMLTTS